MNIEPENAARCAVTSWLSQRKKKDEDNRSVRTAGKDEENTR
jgi:hypothetical protein